MFYAKTVLLAAAGIFALASAIPFSVDNGTCSVCVDLSTVCRQPYGGCYDFCAEPMKQFNIPDCGGETNKTQICEYHKNDCQERFGGCYPTDEPIPLFTEPACPPTEQPPPPDPSCRICLDEINDCQKMFGGCYDFCAEPSKQFDVPECNGVSGLKRICEWKKNDCGTAYGGCYDAEGPIPNFAVPECDAT